MEAYVPFVSRTCARARETDPSSLCSPSPACVIYFSRLLAKQHRREEDAVEELPRCAATATGFARSSSRTTATECDGGCQGRDIGRFEWRLTLLKYCNCILSCAISRVRSARDITLRNMFGERPFRIVSEERAKDPLRNRTPRNKNSLGREGRFRYLSRTRYIHICVTVGAQGF